ncbi:MAG: isoleucine--tRNA ligase, partial [Sulfurimonas sp.]
LTRKRKLDSQCLVKRVKEFPEDRLIDHAKEFNVHFSAIYYQFKKLGILSDWEHPYLTMDYNFEANIYRTLCDVANKGLLVERSKPVFWSWAERTALAEAEVEYEDKESHSIYVAFELSDESKIRASIEGDAALVIWTTTPWTLPANVGISLNPEEKYVRSSDGYIVAKERYHAMVEQEIIKGKIVQEFDAAIFENLHAINPLNGRRSHIVLGDHVLMDSGTGCVHTAPGHGEDDYKIGLKYNLDVIMPVDETGCFDATVVREKLLPNPEEFVGKHIFKSNDAILEYLGSSLLHVNTFVHSYPHCWRSHTPLIFRATKQWFISVDDTPHGESRTLRDIAVDDIKKTAFYPETGRNRLNSMVENRPDWCISRQRDWGVPIAFFRVKATGKVILDEKVVNFIAMVFEMQGSDAWYNLPIESLLYPGSGYKADELEKVTDILDVWFDSGATWNAVLKSRNYDAGTFPADLYLEGSDQHRGWFQSSLFLSAAIAHQAPYKTVLTHGFTVDAKGEKMSKSKGNVIAPDKVIKQYGSEILRLWVAMSDYQGDLKISDDILKQTAESYRKLRNTFRFLMANINDLETMVAFEEMGILDQWIVSKADDVFRTVHRAFSEYNFVNGMGVLNHFVVNELSGIYMDLTKDRLYCDAKDALHRRSSQSAMAMIAKNMLLLLAPVLTYTADEIIEHAPAIIKENHESIFDFTYHNLETFSVVFDESYMLQARDAFFEVVDRLKKEKTLKATLELVITTTSSTLSVLEATEVEDWFVVSGVNTQEISEPLGSFEVDGDSFVIGYAALAKCPRCWKFKSSAKEQLCQRCSEVLA